MIILRMAMTSSAEPTMVTCGMVTCNCSAPSDDVLVGCDVATVTPVSLNS